MAFFSFSVAAHASLPPSPIDIVEKENAAETELLQDDAPDDDASPTEASTKTKKSLQKNGRAEKTFSDDKGTKDGRLEGRWREEKEVREEKEARKEKPAEHWQRTEEVWNDELGPTRKGSGGLVKHPQQCRKILEKEGAEAALDCAEEVDKTASHPFTLELKLLVDKKENAGVAPGKVWKRVVNSGMAEAIAAGAFVGGVGAFLGAATISATFRIDDAASYPMLVASPALGVLTGVAVTTGISLWAGNRPGESALLSSLAVQGLIHGILLQAVFFPPVTDIWAIPLRFVSVFGVMGGAVLSGGLAGRLLPIEAGDVAVANSAAFWAPLILLSMAAEVNLFGFPLFFPTLELVSAAAFIGTLLASPLLSIKRPTSWLIDLGGAAGFFLGTGAALVAGFRTVGLIYGASMILGVAAGTGAAIGLHKLLDGKDPIAGLVDFLQEQTQVKDAALLPTLLAPVEDRRSTRLEPTKLHPGLLFSGRF